TNGILEKADKYLKVPSVSTAFRQSSAEIRWTKGISTIAETSFSVPYKVKTKSIFAARQRFVRAVSSYFLDRYTVCALRCLAQWGFEYISEKRILDLWV